MNWLTILQTIALVYVVYYCIGLMGIYFYYLEKLKAKGIKLTDALYPKQFVLFGFCIAFLLTSWSL